ncbi:integrase arm-type DNA-binding domain-containing protein [Variovorax sp. LG9.2]|nr:integrase arm-type DNA-binding domain-containing protein [Variovorax sp. LG9.2]
MPRKAPEMSPLEVKRLSKPGLHFVGGVPGLGLHILSEQARSWLLRYPVAGKRREMGLGGYPAVTLADARQRAREERQKLDSGVDPILARREAKSAMRAKSATEKTFQQVAEAYIEAHGEGWRNAKHRQQWTNTLKTFAYPVLGSLLVRDVSREHVLDVLRPIWNKKTETASRLRGRIESVLAYAMQQKYRPEELNPARWAGMDKTLLNPAKLIKMKAKKYAALPAHEMGAFMTRLRAQAGLAAKALEFGILCASRSGEVRGALWSEIDLDAAVWRVPAERMKAHKEHRVPLSPQAVALLEALPKMANIELVFPAPRGGMLSDMALVAVMRRMKVPAVPHGFRSTFKDWISESTNYPNEVSEMALAHVIENQVEAAYRRGDLFEKRTKMMAEWADFCDRVATDAKADLSLSNTAA